MLSASAEVLWEVILGLLFEEVGLAFRHAVPEFGLALVEVVD